jgi:hypothetical protein
MKRQAKKNHEPPALDMGSRMRGNHQLGVVTGARVMTEGGIVVHEGAKARADDVLEGMFELGLLLGVEGSLEDRKAVARSRLEAGQRMQRMFHNSGLMRVPAVDPGRLAAPGGPSDAQMRAQDQFTRMMKAMGQWGEIAAGPCCYNATPNTPTAIGNVKRALDRLCEYLKL